MTKRCVRCDQMLPIEDFHLDSHRKGGRQSKCKKCQYARYLERKAEDPEKLRRIGRESQRRNRKRRAYGITNEQFDEMVTVRQGCCDMCKKPAPPKVGIRGGLCVDHDHVTGEIRGLLCHNCNRALGLMGDTLEAAQAAVAYLHG